MFVWRLECFNCFFFSSVWSLDIFRVKKKGDIVGGEGDVLDFVNL